MAGLLKWERGETTPTTVFDAFERWLRDWAGGGPWEELTTGLIKVDQYRENGALVVRAELPGIDPDKDVRLTVVDGTLRIEAERREEERIEEKGYVRKEIRTGSFARTLPLPSGVKDSDITAEYKDGILTIRVPAAEAREVKKIPIAKS